MIIANLLHALGITYAYEQPFTGQDGSVRYPDFTIEDAETGRRVFLEHLGLMSEPAYRRRWLAKLDWYRSQGVLPEDEGEGDAGILVTTPKRKASILPALSANCARFSGFSLRRVCIQ